MSFDHLQTYQQAKTAPFRYEIPDVMPKYKAGDIVKDHRGKPWRVISIDTFSAYFDTDSYHQATEFSAEKFLTRRGKSQTCTVVEHFERGTFQHAMYRWQKSGFNVRIA